MADGKDEKKEKPKSVGQIVSGAFGAAFRGGIPGLLAMVVQVLALMWMRTLVNYQYSKGGTIAEAFTTLYNEGGIARFYAGLWPALIVGPLSRFGDVGANDGIKAMCVGIGLDKMLPTWLVTGFASAGAAAWRIIITPVSNIKTAMQVNGAAGLATLLKKGATNPFTFWDGAMGTMGATWLGHYPWFVVNNYLEKMFPERKGMGNLNKYSQRAAIGFCSSFVSDCVSNGLRVITVAKQTAENDVGYLEIALKIIEDGGGGLTGFWGLIGRGLLMKILVNGASSMLFRVVWKYLEDQIKASRAKKDEKLK